MGHSSPTGQTLHPGALRPTSQAHRGKEGASRTQAALSPWLCWGHVANVWGLHADIGSFPGQMRRVPARSAFLGSPLPLSSHSPTRHLVSGAPCRGCSPAASFSLPLVKAATPQGLHHVHTLRTYCGQDVFLACLPHCKALSGIRVLRWPLDRDLVERACLTFETNLYFSVSWPLMGL